MIATYCNDTVVPVVPAPTEALDKELMRRTGRDLAEGYVRHPPLGDARAEAARDRAEVLV